MGMVRRGLVIVAFCLLAPLSGVAQDEPEARSNRLIEFRFTPTERAQMALWVEKADGTFVRTVRLTEATAYRGIGNRPGALQMNSGFRWPYGRREGVLPVWGHRRAEAAGNARFPRVIFQDRASEGYASRTSNDASRDDYFCLSFNSETTRRDALDAVSCASVFNSDKGRYLTEQDENNGYAEPWEEPNGEAQMRPLEVGSIYPPRRDVSRCTTAGCSDHPDVADFAGDARETMPHIDAVTMATPAGGEPQTVRFQAPADIEDGPYVAWLEVNTEGDYNEHWNDEVYPTPDSPADKWDVWAKTFGYPYRGQPSVVYRVPFVIGPAGGTFGDMELAGYGALHGRDGEIRDMDGRISNDPADKPGSGADRLLDEASGPRFSVRVVPTNVCDQPNPPPSCGVGCGPQNPCGDGLVCGPDATCVGVCDVSMPPPPIDDFFVEPHDDVKESHRFAHLSFTVPEHGRPIARYEVRFTPTREIVDAETFTMAEEAKRGDLEGEALSLPVNLEPGELVEEDFGILVPQTRYSVAIRAQDICGDEGPIVTDTVTTTETTFTTVSPCFVATAAHGSAMADEVGSLRRFRDRHLMSNALGRAFVEAYYAVGPYAADFIRERDTLRGAVRTLLSPLVELARLTD
jgi:hypothetical protein